MKAKGQIGVLEIPNIGKPAKRLPNKLIAKGDVLKVTIFKLGKSTVDVLLLAPSSSVCTHKHVDSSEWYIDLCGNNMEFCAIGQEHELVNTANDKWLIVLAVKRFV